MQKELVDSLRSVWLIVFTAVYALLVLGIPFILLLAFHLFGQEDLPARLTLVSVETVPIIPLLPLLLGALSIVGEREKGTMEHLLSQPVSKVEVFLGKFTGLFLANSFVVVAGVGIAGMFGYVFAPTGFNGTQYATTILLLVSLSVISLGLGILVSSFSRSRAVAVGLTLFIWFLLSILFELGLLEFILITISGESLLLVVLSLLNPIDVTRILAVMNTEPVTNRLGPSGAEMLRFFGFNGAALILIVTSIIWILAPVLISLWIFIHQDA